MKQVLSVRNMNKYYGSKDSITKAVDDISFDVDQGEFIGVMGPSGSGKTTLLNCISTIDHSSSGNILIDGEDITKLKGNALSAFRRNTLGFIFQDFNLLDTLTAYENIALALTIKSTAFKEIDKKVKQIAEQLDIKDTLSKYPYQLSGGQKQRVAAARALMNDPKLLLADEPTGALDSKSSRSLLEAMTVLNEELNTTIMMVTHDSFTASYAKRILFIKDGKIFNELYRGEDSRKEFFHRIIDVVSVLGGDVSNVF